MRINNNTIFLPTICPEFIQHIIGGGISGQELLNYWCSTSITSSNPVKYSNLIGNDVVITANTKPILVGTIEDIKIMSVYDTYHDKQIGAESPAGSAMLGLPNIETVYDFLNTINATFSSTRTYTLDDNISSIIIRL